MFDIYYNAHYDSKRKNELILNRPIQVGVLCPTYMGRFLWSIYWIIHNAITYEGFRFDLSITLIVIAFIYGGISSGFITTLIFASLQVFVFPSAEVIWLVVTYLIVSIVVLYLKNEAPDRFISFPIIFGIALILCLPYIHHVRPDDAKAMSIFFSGNACAGLLLHSILHQIRWHFNQVRMHRRLALTDTLTGLDNRRRLEETVKRYKSQQMDFSIMIIVTVLETVASLASVIVATRSTTFPPALKWIRSF